MVTFHLFNLNKFNGYFRSRSPIMKKKIVLNCDLNNVRQKNTLKNLICLNKVLIIFNTSLPLLVPLCKTVLNHIFVLFYDFELDLICYYYSQVNGREFL